MESKIDLEVGTRVNVLGEKAEIFDLVESNPAVVKVKIIEGRAAGAISIAVLKQIERD